MKMMMQGRRSPASRIVCVACCIAAAAAAVWAVPSQGLTLGDEARTVLLDQVSQGQRASAPTRSASEASLERDRTRTAFRGLSPTAARQVLLEQHPSLVSRPGWLRPSLIPALEDAVPLSPNVLSLRGSFGSDSIVLTSQPVAFRDDDGVLRKIDLSPVETGDGGVAPRSAPFDLSMPASLDRGIAVGSGDRRFSILPVVSNGGGVAVEQYAGFYGDVDQDTDFVAKPVLGGVETFSILRSPASPEVLRVRLDAGAGSVLLGSGIVPGYGLWRGEQELAAVSPPRAWDAEHRPVDVETTVEGDELVMRVDHRDRDVAYPIVVDPTVIDTCYVWLDTGSACQVDAWETSTSSTFNSGYAGWAYEAPTGGRFAQYFGPGYLGTGLYIRTLVQNYYTKGEAGDWYYRAPSGVRIWSALFANLSQDNLADNMSCLFVGVLENNLAWGRGSPGTFCAQRSIDQSWKWCPGTTCSDQSGGTPGNAAVFGAMAQRTGWSSYWMDHMGGAAIAMTEMDWPAMNPYISSPDFPDDWQTDPNRSITIHVGDAGLGLRSIAFSSPENPTWQAIDADTGAAANRTYSCFGGTRLACPRDVWIHMKIGNLREGYSTIRVRATDLVGKTYTYEHAIAVRAGSIDVFPPPLALSGPAVANASQLDDGAWDLDATASDSSGIATIAYSIDGTSLDVQQQDGCASCTVSAEFTVDTEELAPGPHVISVVATDRAGNQTTSTLSSSVSSTTALDSVSSAQAPTMSDYVRPAACANTPPFTPYYGGASVATLALTFSVSTCDPSEDGYPGYHSVSYAYGSCDASEGSCATPLTITSSPLCEAHASIYRDELNAQLPYTALTLLGVPAASFEDGSTVELYAGNTTIGISSFDPGTTMAAVAAIRQAPATDVPAAGSELWSWPSAGGTTAAAMLPQPDSSVLNASEATCG